MRTRGAVITKVPGAYEVIDLEVDDPRPGELLVRMAAAGLCHSDDHLATGDLPVPVFPYLGGHEGAGVVEAVGPATAGWEVGDHVVFSFLPSCGRCRWCAAGMQNLCDMGAHVITGTRFDDLTSYRVHTLDGDPVGQMCGLGTFSELTCVDVRSAIKIDADVPLDKACLLGCAVGTGWGSAVNSAQVRPGDTVLVLGVGGIGANAVQGAVHAGASHVVAVDPVELKRTTALQLGATAAFSDVAEATDFVWRVTGGQGADAAIVAVGVVHGEHVAQAFAAVRKAGTVVVTALGDVLETGIPVSIGELTLFQKRIQGSLFGASSPTGDIPRLVQLYRDGRLQLDLLITAEYRLDDVAKGYEDLHAGRNIRGVVRF